MSVKRHLFSRRFAATLLIAVAIGFLTPSLLAATNPSAAVKAFFELLKSEKYDALYLHLPSRMQERFTQAQFTASVKRIGDHIILARIDIGRIQQKGNYAVVDTTLYGTLRESVTIQGERVSDGRVLVQQLLIKEGADWKVITADDRVKAFFLREEPNFTKDFQLESPRLEFKQKGKWQRLQ